MTMEYMEVITVEIAKLSLKPGERLVVRVASPMTENEVSELKKYLYTFLGPDIPGIILVGDDITLSVIEPAEKLF